MNAHFTASERPETLYLRLSEDSLCFARYEHGREQNFVFSPYHVRPQTSLAVNLREACRTEEILKAPVSRVHVLVVAAVTAVPLADFQEEDCERIHGFCFPSERKRRVFYDILPACNVALLFALDEDICRTIEDVFPEVRYVSAQTAVLRHFAEKGMASGCKRVFVHRHEHVADVALYEDHRLLMLNTYTAKAAVDVAYYTLNAAQNLGVDCATTPFYVTGTPEDRESTVPELQKYVAEVYSVNPTGEFNRHAAAVAPDVPYDLTALLAE